MVRSTSLVAALALAVVASSPARAARQSTPRPQLYVVRNVRLSEAPDAPHVNLLLRSGRVERVLELDAQLPPGAREVDGQGNLALPAFIDAFTTAGCVTPPPKVDRDVPPSMRSDVLVDMREANRKGIEPAFRAADVLELAKDKSKGWRESGFGVLLASPSGQLLSGTSALATTRDAAARDALLAPEVFADASFRASGEGYPSTLMGFVAQLRQFFLDARHQRDLEQRYAAGRPGPRPPFDEDLRAIGPVLEHQRRVLCEADTSRDIERWIALADEVGFDLAIAGGREAWRVRDTLAARRIPVILTLDWGEEPKDPHEKEKAKQKEEEEKKKKEASGEKPGEKPSEPTPPATEPKPQEPPSEKPAEKPSEQPPSEAPAEKPAEVKPQEPVATKPGEEKQGEAKKGEEKKAEEKKDEPKPFEYEEPLAVREERRRLWEEGRDCALRLQEAGVPFAFGTAGASAADLLKKVRTLVEHGLASDAALTALTTNAARVLGVEAHLGTLAAGSDATLAVWTASPTKSDAKLAWLFVDGFPFEFEIEKKDDAAKPEEGLDASGEWAVVFEAEGEEHPGTAKLEMKKDGSVEGTFEIENPAGQGTLSATFRGHVSGKKMVLDGTLSMGPMEIGVHMDVTLEGNTFAGQSTVKSPEGEETNPVRGTRKPKEEVLR